MEYNENTEYSEYKEYISRNKINKYGGCAPGIREMLNEGRKDRIFTI